MGHLKDDHGMTLLGSTPPGTCPECAVKHDPEQPHNRDSLCYQYKFYDQHGRWPTWADAMAHCTPEVKAIWREALKEHGVDIGEEALDHA
ncbi:hypothetical protein [Clostridium sp. D33t1_170424_F3]|uniref:hypothetical protein n=1 Tax=Clostridium sp. D33t1_170424_F3 TaxID=2787099 RepID=UPI0018A925AF|nr:hypothetical protein [Clostridium sp. D33t1_170424_F3]